MSDDININDLVDIPVDSVTEEIADKYHGTKVKIKSVTPGQKKTSYKDNKKLPDGEFFMQPVVYVETETFGTDAKGQPLSVKEEFNLQKMNGKYGFSTSDMSKARKFMKQMKVNKIDEVVGREILVVKATTKSGRIKLAISIQ